MLWSQCCALANDKPMWLFPPPYFTTLKVSFSATPKDQRRSSESIGKRELYSYFNPEIGSCFGAVSDYICLLLSVLLCLSLHFPIGISRSIWMTHIVGMILPGILAFFAHSLSARRTVLDLIMVGMQWGGRRVSTKQIVGVFDAACRCWIMRWNCSRLSGVSVWKH